MATHGRKRTIMTESFKKNISVNYLNVGVVEDRLQCNSIYPSKKTEEK